MPLLTKPLSRQERIAVTMRRAGKTNAEIAEVLCVTNSHVSCVISNARRKGAVVPFARRGAPAPAVPIDRLIEIRKTLLASGRNWGVYSLIGERVGMTGNAVKVRLWKHDHKQQGASQ